MGIAVNLLWRYVSVIYVWSIIYIVFSTVAVQDFFGHILKYGCLILQKEKLTGIWHVVPSDGYECIFTCTILLENGT